MTNYFPPSPLGTTIVGNDQLDLLLWMTFAVSNFSISSFTHWWFFIAIGYGLCDMGSESLVLMVISTNGVVLMDVSSLGNCVSYSLRSASNCD